MPKYHFSYQNSLSHFLNIRVEINGLTDSAKLQLPVWRPGRYEIQNFPKRIKSFKVTNSEGKHLLYKKISKSCWEVELNGSHDIIVEYEYFAGLMDAGNSWLDDEQLYINPINCCIFETSQMNEEVELTFHLPDNYRLASGLKPIGQHKLSAKSYYQLVDSPIFASASIRTISYKVNETDFFIHIQGEIPQSDDELIEDFAPFTQKQLEVMGGFPCKHYHFLIQSLPYKAYHGVEHWNSTVICLGPSADMVKRELYKELLGVSSHELFHTWNVIRLRPKEMTPYNFQGENYHETGFVTEGVTTYYGDLFLIRSGVYSFQEYLGELNKLLKRHYENEGRKNYSVAESSFDLWLDGYEAGIPGRKVSIYNEGALAALILDLSIRLKFDNKKSLDDVMRLMWHRHGKDMTGYSFEDYQQAAEAVYEESPTSYFQNIIRGTEPYENYLKPLLEAFGFHFGMVSASKFEEAHFGFRLMEGKIVSIAPDSPAEAQLSLGDTILSVNGEKLQEEFPQEPSVNLEILRMGIKKHIQLIADSREHFRIFQVVPNSVSSDKELTLLKGWLETI